MRITSRMMSQDLLRNLQAAEQKMDNLQNQLATGHKINKPSDDPAGIQSVMTIKGNIAAVTQWSSNADGALQFMNTTEGALQNITSMMQRVRDLAVEGSNGTLDTSDQSAVADEVDQLTEQIKMMANSQVGSKYMFSGTATDQQLIPADGSTSTANGNPIMFEVGNNLSIPVSVNGLKLFGNGTSLNGSGGILDTLNRLSTALRSNDSTTVSNLLGTIDDNVNTVIDLNSDLGARINRVTAIQSQLDSTSLSLQTNLSSVQDADMAQTITDFTSQQNVYQAALSVGAKIIQPSLVDFMQ
ncbi:flagellar hook-associated protein FlgL [Desulfosporosinus sp. PR]|uniref:flagellar hook-associated protein FlgL n=1 Tax=Candidatus Desulfosporosinus nitrosoreducens TaxID=3401928 RepID=UPI0027F63B8A|nr:flagellar hook-associated protein FlgL [Desulfosporosinus sp. PR]MDQ7096263.1 flagellar hook-associated protein FlgL [Desulfosporosinus sp. PR]